MLASEKRLCHLVHQCIIWLWNYHWTNLCCSSISCTEHGFLEECRYWDTRQQNPAHTQQLPERCYAMSVRHPLMVVATADRNIVVYNLANPQVNCCCWIGFDC